MEVLMRTYILAIATAALFAIPTAAFSESIYFGFGPGGVRIGPATAITASTIVTKGAEAAQNCGRLAFTSRN